MHTITVKMPHFLVPTWLFCVRGFSEHLISFLGITLEISTETPEKIFAALDAITLGDPGKNIQ